MLYVIFNYNSMLKNIVRVFFGMSQCHKRISIRYRSSVVYCVVVCDKQMISDVQSVPDSLFSASSSANGTSPANARLDNPTGWRARDGDPSPWLQVDLAEPVTVAGIITQGIKVTTLWKNV